MPGLSDSPLMRRLNGLALLTIGVMACLVAPALARVGANDAVATHDYLEARIALHRTMTAAETRSELKVIVALATQVKTECPNVLVGAPPHVKGEKTNQADLEVSEELWSVPFSAAEHVAHPADTRFARSVRGLHWSNRKLTKLLHSLALEQAEQSAIPPPNLCSDLKYWVASGYTAVSADTKQFLHRQKVVSSITQIEPEANEPLSNLFNLDALVARRLKPYEDHTDQLLVKKAFLPEAKPTNPAFRPLFEAIGEVYTALGSPPALEQ
jgi:hypothetical protein